MPAWIRRTVRRKKGLSETDPYRTAGDVPPRRLAAVAAAVTAYLEAEAAAGQVTPAFRVKAVTGPWKAPGGEQGLGWAQVGRIMTMLERQQLAARRRTSLT